jgi:hypothetical protein
MSRKEAINSSSSLRSSWDRWTHASTRNVL